MDAPADTIKALTVKPYWADKIARGEKTLEIRSRRTHYRGPLLICASARPGKLPEGHIGAKDLPRGVARCKVQLVDCRPFTPADIAASGGVPWQPGLFAWELTGIEVIDPFPVKGQLSMFTVRSSRLDGFSV